MTCFFSPRFLPRAKRIDVVEIEALARLLTHFQVGLTETVELVLFEK